MVNKKPVSKTAYCLLAFFLGGIGIHKFYSGRIAAGILYLLFCWTGIPAFIAFIEFIIGICKESDSNGMIWV
ncbi:MAG: TM2 domain-containing protein [Lachnospiraceae bacterium]|nr:TM2 domain-containing protein [Lachnospiraceae bacterium]